MDNDLLISSYLGFTAAVIVFFAAVIPVVYAIWSRAQGAGKEQEFFSIVYIAGLALLSIGVLLALFIFNNYWAGILCFIGIWLMSTYHFLTTKSAVSRRQIVDYVVMTGMLVLFLLMCVIMDISQGLLGNISGIIEALEQ